MGSASNRLQITINIQAPAFIRFKDSGLNLEELPVHKIYCCLHVFRKFFSPHPTYHNSFYLLFPDLIAYFAGQMLLLEKSNKTKMNILKIAIVVAGLSGIFVLLGNKKDSFPFLGESKNKTEKK